MFRPLKPYQLIVDVVVAGAFALAALGSELIRGSSAPENILASVLTCLLLAGSLAVRRLSPGLALTIAWAGAVVQMAFGRPPIFADVAIFAVLYTSAAYGSRRTFWAGFASSLIGAVVITCYLFVVPDFAGGRLSLSTLPIAVALLVAAAFALGLAWTVGALVRTAIRARANREAQERAEEEAATEQERVRIARDMHDIVAHSLAVVIAQADGARYAIAAGSDTDSDAASQTLATISTTARSALADVRLLLTQLRHSQSAGPQPTIADLDDLYAQVRTAGVDLRVDVEPTPVTPPPAAVQLAVYRILQEALTNALRHGAPGPVAVRLSWHPTRIDLVVANPVAASRAPGGEDTPFAAVERSGREQSSAGHGVIGMRERAQLVGGSLDAGAEGAAFIVRATIPIGVAG